jgi:hypothetical protein
VCTEHHLCIRPLGWSLKRASNAVLETGADRAPPPPYPPGPCLAQRNPVRARMTTSHAPIWIGKRRQFLHVLARVEGPAPGVPYCSWPSYSFTSATRLSTDAEYFESGISGRPWSVKRQNVYAHYIRALGLDEEAVSEDVYSKTAVQRVHAKIKFVPSGVAVNFTLDPADDGGERYVADIWARIHASFGEDMARHGAGVEPGQWRLTYVDQAKDESLLLDGPTMKFAVEQALRSADVLCMSLSPKPATFVPPTRAGSVPGEDVVDGMQSSTSATPGASASA